MRLALLAVVALGAIVAAVSALRSSPGPDVVAPPVAPLRVVQLHDPRVPRLRHQLAQERLRAHGLARTLAHTPTTQEAIQLACSAYGSCSTLWRRAECESRLDASAHNPSGASGLFQFLPSTWTTTPFAALSIWSPYASAMAAGWMQAQGRGGEWSCR